jgi:hypothetical protein
VTAGEIPAPEGAFEAVDAAVDDTVRRPTPNDLLEHLVAEGEPREVVGGADDAGHDDLFPSPESPDGVVGAGEGLEVVVATRRTRISALRLRSLSRADRSSSARSFAGMKRLMCEVLRSTARAYRRERSDSHDRPLNLAIGLAKPDRETTVDGCLGCR